MLQLLIWFVALNLLSLLFYFIVLMRVSTHVKPYHFHETRETKLFGFITIRVVFFLYFFCLLASLLVQALLIFPFR